MLVVVANWGIADGTLFAAARHEQVDWLRTVRRAAIHAGFRRDGRYRPPDRIDVVLAGDTFDLLASTAWIGSVRPWQRGPRAAAVRDRVLTRAAERGGRLLAGLRRWVRHGMPVPGVGRHGRPSPDAETHVPAGVAILAGDRDAWLEDAHAVALRHGIVLGGAWSGSDCAASVRHGHEFDPYACGEDESRRPGDRGPTLAESIAVDLVARFGAALQAEPGAWPATRPLVAALAGTRPAQVAGVFRRWRQRHGVPPAMVGDLWSRAVDAWWREARRTGPTCAVEYDPLDAIAATLASAGADDTGTAEPFDLPVGLPAPHGLPEREIVTDHGVMSGAGMTAPGPLVLGHPPAASGRAGATTAPLVCLGTPPGVRGWPHTAVFTRHGEAVHYDRLADEPAGAIVDCSPDMPARLVEAA